MKRKKPDEMVHFNILSTCSSINIHHALRLHLRIPFGFKTQYLFLQYPPFIFSSTLPLLGLAPLQTHFQTPQAPRLIIAADSDGAGMDGSSSAEMK
jgi:hypothetical protein